MAYVSLPFEVVQLVRLLKNPGFWIRLIGAENLRTTLTSICLSGPAQTWVAERARIAFIVESHPKARSTLALLLEQLNNPPSHSAHANDLGSLSHNLSPGNKHATH